MPRVIPSLFKLIGDGFVDDAYAADGNHLRWMFDPRLGFPRHAFCLERRPSVSTKPGQQNVRMFFESFRLSSRLTRLPQPQEVPSIVRDAIAASRPGASITVSDRGVALGGDPVLLDFHGGSGGYPEPYVCWVRLMVLVQVPGGRVRADAVYINRGEEEVVDRQERVFPRRPVFPSIVSPVRRIQPGRPTSEATDLASLLERPQLGLTPPLQLPADLRPLYQRLLRLDRAHYLRVTPDFLRRLHEALERAGLDLDDIRPGGVMQSVMLQLTADRIDRIYLTGVQAILVQMEWAHSEDVINARDWRPVACFPMATHEEDYWHRNAELAGTTSADALAEQRVLDPMPHGAEPLDDHQVPPSRPPTPDELRTRYLKPWTERLEPWLRAVLAESLSGDLHQAEITLTQNVTEFGQAAADGVPDTVREAADKTMSIEPYGMLLSAACTFTTARLLGLAAVDRPSEEATYDYRVRGIWRSIDIVAWGRKLLRDFQRLLEQRSNASPFERASIDAAIFEKYAEIITTNTFIEYLTGGGTSDYVDLWALKIGVAPTKHDLFEGPEWLQASLEERRIPEAGVGKEAVSLLEWPLRQRERAVVHETVPLAAAIGRREEAAAPPYATMANPRDPDFGIHTAIVPAGEEDDPGAPGTADFRDRRVPEGRDLRYGVTEADPFGRWSAFVETPFMWVDETPPPAPVQVSAELDEAGTPPQLRLRVHFAWAADLHDPDDHTFFVHLRRLPLPSDWSERPNDPAIWGLCERQAGTGAAPFAFDGSFSGSDSHDGMPVQVAFSDITRSDPGGGTHAYREFTVEFAGLVVDRDAVDRAVIYAGISTEDAAGRSSTEVGGPGRAEHYRAVPPPTPTLPPDPELATFADAEHMSSYTLQWAGAANTRYIIYRAGEREVVKMAAIRGADTSAYREDDPPNFRAAALKQLAVHARDAFEPRSELVPEPPRETPNGPYRDPKDWPPVSPGPRSFTDELPGKLRTLSIYAVLGRSPSGVPSAWPGSPGAFAVVQVPHVPQPTSPVVIRSQWKPAAAGTGPGSDHVELLIAEPPPGSAPVTSYEVYRTIDPSRSHDYRLMRPLHRLDSPAFLTNGVADVAVAAYVDPTAAPWATSFYRVVARSPGLGGTAHGMRSEASALAEVQTFSSAPPPPPSDVTVVRATTSVHVGFRAHVPVGFERAFQFELIRIDGSGTRLVLGKATASRAATATASEYEFEVDSVLLPNTIEIDSEPLPVQVIVKVTNSLGKSSESVPAVVP